MLPACSGVCPSPLSSPLAAASPITNPSFAHMQVLLFLTLVAAAAAEGSRSHEEPYRSHESYESEEPKYEYSYQVKDDNDNDFGNEENRDGDLTKGSFYNHLPDGRRQTVKYVVDRQSGFLADVNYEGEAHYDSGSYESHHRQVRESSRPGHGSDSREQRESPFSFLSRHSRHSSESRFRFGFQDSLESGRPSRESRESTENNGNSRSSESRRHHSPVYYQPMLDSVEYQSRSDESDEDYLMSAAYFIDNYRPQIRYQPS
ncbi:Pro-resilin [Portunus trituberculatus]|uniref:Pro-resilin n=1 Tax=Portunus trituberculatus TaxID=210409 RepID=A0A5B7FB28_PORTR|nr:Pro-resilin [Portunus trituberculatus]